jgi:hypothetical protein
MKDVPFEETIFYTQFWNPKKSLNAIWWQVLWGYLYLLISFIETIHTFVAGILMLYYKMLTNP